MLADAHIHLFCKGFPGRYGTLFAGHELVVYEGIRRVHSIERALVVGYEGEPWSAGNNRYLARLAPLHPWMVPLAFHHLTAWPSHKHLNSLWRLGFAGLALYVTRPEQVAALLAWPAEAIAELNRRQAIVSVNCSSKVAGKLRPFFLRLPHTRILISHLGMPGKISGARERLRQVLTLADLPQVGVKLSGAYACNAYPHPDLDELIAELVAVFGSSRLYWGSDFSPALDYVSFAQTIEPFRNLPGISKRAIFSENLQSIIRRVQWDDVTP
jgi:hypothetical protein